MSDAEIRVWRPKREAQKACVSEASLPKRDVQQREVRASPQRHETRVSTTKRGIQKVRMSQPSLTKCDNQQREVRISAHQRHETHVSKSKSESRACSTQRELRVSEHCVSDSRRKGGSQKLKSSQKPDANLFDPYPTDLRDYLIKKRSANQIAPSCYCERLISECRYM